MFLELGYQAVMVTDTAFLRNPNYHTINDLPETLDYEKMKELMDYFEYTIGKLE